MASLVDQDNLGVPFFLWRRDDESPARARARFSVAKKFKKCHPQNLRFKSLFESDHCLDMIRGKKTVLLLQALKVICEISLL
jgi:hypothetical protein